MKRKLLVMLNGRQYSISVDDELDSSLRKILKSEYQYNNDGVLNLEEKSLEANYQVKQVLLKKLLMAMPQNENGAINDRLKNLEGYTHNKNAIYYSDLQELERIYFEASDIYKGILSGKYKEKEPIISSDEKDLKDINTFLNRGNDEEFQTTLINDDQQGILNSREDINNDGTNRSEEDTSSVDLKGALEEVAEAPELQEYITEEKIDGIVNNVRIAKSNQEFRAETGKDERTLNIREYVKDAQAQNKKIILPPVDNIKEVVLDVYATLNNNDDIQQAVNNYKERKGAFNSGIQNSFNTLRSNLKLRGGINSRNLNAFGNDFLASYIELCRETGTNPEEMFKEYFSNSASTRANSVLNKFITQFIRANGGDESLRDLIEATFVKKAIANNLVSSKYNSYLKEGYRELSFNRNGTINFDFKAAENGTSTVSNNLEGSFETHINGDTAINGEIGLNASINTEVSGTNSGVMTPGAVNTSITSNRPNVPNIPNHPNVNGKITQNVPGANLGNMATIGAKADLDKLNNFNGVSLNNGAISNPAQNKVPINALDGVPANNLNDQANIPNVGASVPSFDNPEVGAMSSPSMGLAEPQKNHNNKFAQNRKLGNKRGKASPLGLINNRDKNLRQRTDKQDLIPGSGLRKNNLMNPQALNELENDAERENDFNDSAINNNENMSNDNLNENNQLSRSHDDNNASNPLEDVKDKLKKEAAKKIGQKILIFIMANPWVLIILGIFLLIFIPLIMGNGDDNAPKMTGLGGYSYLKLENVCEEIYVYDTPSGVDGTYPLEEYVAGVVAHEVGAFNNDTLYEVFAIAARTYALNRLKNSDSCSIKGNSTAQVFGKTDNERIIAAANKTRGLVLTRNGSMISTEYDAFCWDTKDDNYYYVCQKNYDTGEALKVPVDWATEHVGRISGKPFLENARYHSHGRGISQDGAWYMAEELGYDKDKIISFFFGSDAKIMSIYASSYSGEFPLNPNDELYQNLAFLIDESLESFLGRSGTSVEEFNNYLKNVAETSGAGTRESVVNTAVSFIGSLANMGYKLNYDWGGRHDQAGVNPNWGARFSPTCSSYPGGPSYCYYHHKWHSMDCNGFVNWVYANAFGNEEYGKRRIYNKTRTSIARKTEIKLDAKKAVCQPGDIMIKPGSHIVLVVGIDDAKKKYIVAESTGSNITTREGGVKLSYYSYNAYDYFCSDMSSIYE